MGSSQAGQPATEGPDFNGDGYADLAVGVPFEDEGFIISPGAVNVLYGSAAGLTAAGNQLWSQDSPGVADEAERDDRFGSALAAGDMNGDGYADLAVGVPIEGVGSIKGAGAVNVFYGSSEGLSSAGNQSWTQDSPGVADQAEIDDYFGQALAAGDLNGDGYADLVVGVPFEDLGTVSDPGAVNVLYGWAGGLTATGNQLWSQDSPGVTNQAGSSERFGHALSEGDLNGDGYADLAVGVPFEDVGEIGDEGAISLLYGSAGGLTAAGNELWSQDSPGVADRAELFDQFGSALSSGDLNGDGYADLAVGVPIEGVRSIEGAGAVNVLYGSAGGLTATGNQLWTQDSAGVADQAERSNAFGSPLAAGDLNGDGDADLAVGVPYEDVRFLNDYAGAVNVLYGSARGLSSAGNQFGHQDTPGIRDQAEVDDAAGSSLA